MQVSVLASSAEERWDKGRVFELNFEFITSGRRMFPGVATSTVSAVSLSCTAADEATASDFSFSVVDAIKYGAAVAGQAVSTAMAWQRKAQRLSNDATNLLNMVSSLGGNSGRYAGGRTVGGLTGSPKSTTSTNTTADLVAQGSANRASVATAGTSLTNNAAALNPADIASSAQVLASATLASSVNPADAIRLISSLADFTPNDPTSDTPIGNAMGAMQSAMGDLFRRAAAAALARASSTYQPASADDAAAIQAQVCAVLDAEITIAGDDGQDDTFNALRAMRSAVVKDMSTRGAALASITTISVTRSLPASVLAQRLYRDPSRADELVIQANPRHPAFMPLSFKALSN
jgi:prophage DNA circulation protein